MAKLQIVYNSNEEVNSIIKMIEDNINNISSDEHIHDKIQQFFQTAFDEGRRFEINMKSVKRDSILPMMIT